MGCKLPLALLILLFALPNNLNSFPTNAPPTAQQDSQPFQSNNPNTEEVEIPSVGESSRTTVPSSKDENTEVEVTPTDFPSTTTPKFQPEEDEDNAKKLKRRESPDKKPNDGPVDEKEKTGEKENASQKENSNKQKKGNQTESSKGNHEDAHKHKPTGRGLIGKVAHYDFHYLDDSDIPNPNLTYFTFYNVNKFYPPWTYHGFYPPATWHEVPIEYFSRPTDLSLLEKTVGVANYNRHKSAMWICSGRVTLDSRKCVKKVENECMNDLPSPINILRAEAKEDRAMKSFAFFYFDMFFGFDMFIPEDGTDLLFLTFLPPKRTMERRPSVSSGSIGNHELYLDRISFHLGRDQYSGSEHALDGKRYGMEVQLYFTGDKSAYWESLSKYKFLKANDPQKGHNMHVFSVMVSVGRPGATKPDDETQEFSERFELLSLAAMMFWPSVNVEKRRVTRLTRKLVSLEDFLGVPAKGIYYTYEGSLTHPPCLKHAKWTVFEDPIWITYEQWLRFATITSEFSDQNFLAGNFRRMSDILIKTDVPTFLEMRKAEGLHTLAQKELDREINIKYADKDSEYADPELYVIQQYSNFEKYYARKVTKRGPIEDDQDQNENDYYDTIQDNGDSHLAPKIVLQIICLILIKIKLIY